MENGEAIEIGRVQPKVYLNGFPKAGLHLLELMVRPVVNPMPASAMFVRPWVGTFVHNSWSAHWADLGPTRFKLSTIQPGKYLKGHCGYRGDLARMMELAGICMVVVYRDLRDVAVSQVYHILNDNDEQLVHPGKERFRELGGFEDVLLAVIDGLDEYAGLVERWALYAEWLNTPWVLALKYEDLRQRPEVAASLILRYTAGRTAKIFAGHIAFDRRTHDEMVAAMVAESGKTELSATFRRGVVGGWREHFTREAAGRFLQTGGADWLVKLGYEKDNDWCWST